jgi:hypothetical protein
LPLPPEKSPLYAASQPSATLTPFAFSLRQYASQPFGPSPYSATVARRKARPGDDVAGDSTTSLSFRRGSTRSSSVRGGGFAPASANAFLS